MITKVSVIISLIYGDNFFLSLHVSDMSECIPITPRKATQTQYKHYSFGPSESYKVLDFSAIVL